MPAFDVKIKLFGLKGSSSSKTQLTESVENGTTIDDVWLKLRSEANPDDKIATIDRRILLALINGTPIAYLNGWETSLVDGDQITFLIKTAGG